jgi:hypothetical protein
MAGAPTHHESGGSNAAESSLCCHMGPLLGWHVVLQAEQKIGKKEGFGYSIQLNREEPSPNKWGGVLCVAQDHKVICKHDYIGESRGLVGCSWLESITVVVGWLLSILIVTQYRLEPIEHFSMSTWNFSR